MTTYDVPSTYVGRPIDYRTLAGAISVFVGGYLVTAALTGQLALFLGGRMQVDIEVIVLLVSQAIFALAVVIVGLSLVRASVTARLIATVVLVAVVVIAVATQSARLNGNVGPASMPLSFTLANPYFMGALGVGAAWLIVRSARLGWLAILAAAILIPLPFAFAYAGIAGALTQTVLLALSGLILAGIVFAGRPLRE